LIRLHAVHAATPCASSSPLAERPATTCDDAAGGGLVGTTLVDLTAVRLQRAVSRASRASSAAKSKPRARSRCDEVPAASALAAKSWTEPLREVVLVHGGVAPKRRRDCRDASPAAGAITWRARRMAVIFDSARS